MTEENLEDKLVDACAVGNKEACIALAHLKSDRVARSLFRIHLARFSGLFFLITITPIIIGIMAILFFTSLLFGFLSIGLGIIFLIPLLAFRTWFLTTTIFRATLGVIALFLLWIGLIALGIFFVL